MHQRSLEAFPFDSVLLPYSAVLLRDPGYRADVGALRSTCRERGVAVQTIKSIARRRWRDDDESRRLAWYEPLRDPPAIDRAVRVVLAEPDLFLNSTSDATLLPLVLEAASRLDQPIAAPTDAELDADIHGPGIAPIFAGGAPERI